MKKKVIGLLICTVLSISVLFGGFNAKANAVNYTFAPLCDLPTSPVDQ